MSVGVFLEAFQHSVLILPALPNMPGLPGNEQEGQSINVGEEFARNYFVVNGRPPLPTTRFDEVFFGNFLTDVEVSFSSNPFADLVSISINRNEAGVRIVNNVVLIDSLQPQERKSFNIRFRAKVNVFSNRPDPIGSIRVKFRPYVTIDRDFQQSARIEPPA